MKFKLCLSYIFNLNIYVYMNFNVCIYMCIYIYLYLHLQTYTCICEYMYKQKIEHKHIVCSQRTSGSTPPHQAAARHLTTAVMLRDGASELQRLAAVSASEPRRRCGDGLGGSLCCEGPRVDGRN